MDIESLIDACLKTDPTHASPTLVELERGGPVAYCALKERLSSGTLGPTRAVRAIKCLLIATSHGTLSQDIDRLQFLLSFANHPHKGVRTAAAHALVIGRKRNESRLKVADPLVAAQMPSLDAMRGAVRTALALGVERPFRRLFEEFVNSVG